MEKQNFNDLINKAKASNQTKTIQKVVPVSVKETEEVQFSFYLDKNLLKRIKQQALNQDESIKNIINKALENHLKTS
ncbi:conserved hypothetical protein [Tenacibaculum dicentrarchi]|uniref:CopG family transcriptional regulator n=1 Tax=Tenacibaculum dicentrarchi TaxID=669041 RepID=A0ABM9NV62_9FLAO|nr:hypothetical protein [Tenacibaculum dicentrarchi]MCD8424723.1 hypothetical protein [Tenacibaculum dicentrarchi]MCD8442249.1 hypothetical protein [Tenacibaculum dicentrarchi]WBX68201.1 hypothetical protein PG910_08780 [Tenacibaculum dicentrarchi]SOS51986.1 conserved hypothetical protein [Tenacibaculum dicentrarchi]